MLPNPTLDQLQVFLTVAETGSFSAASRALNRAQSVVSYTIANLEAQLEVPLFERSGARQPKLTEAGKAMLEDARRILGDLQVMKCTRTSVQATRFLPASGYEIAEERKRRIFCPYAVKRKEKPMPGHSIVCGRPMLCVVVGSTGETVTGRMPLSSLV